MEEIVRGLYVGNIKHLKRISHWPGTEYAKTKKVLVWEPEPGYWAAREIWKTHTETRNK